MEKPCRLLQAALQAPLICNQVQEAARHVLTGIPDTMAVVTGDWKEFGRLPVVEWGKVRLAAEHL